MRHLLNPLDFSVEETDELLTLASDIEHNLKKYAHVCDGKKLATLFYEPSTRTRLSFESAMLSLGGSVLGFSSANSSSAAKGESVADTIRMISCYADIAAMRHPKEGSALVASMHSQIPVINAGDGGHQHPTQTLTDLMTIREFKGKLEGLKMCFIGDGNNMMNSLIVGALSTGMSFSAACPKGYMPPEHIIEFGKKYGNGKFEIVEDPMEAAKNADVVYTDVWASMGQEEEKKIREQAFAGYQVNKELMSVTNPECMVLHCLPAHRGEEITADVFEEHANEIFEEAENRLHAQKAVLVECMSDKKIRE